VTLRRHARTQNLPAKLFQSSLLELSDAFLNPSLKLRRRLEHHPIRDSQDSIPFSFQFPVALLIHPGLRFVTMSGSIEFNNEFQGQTTEVHNPAQWELTAKLIAKQLTIAEELPGELLRQGIGMAKFSSTRG
jgi:hypothetical protein